MRVAIVHDWLYVLGGAERVLREMLACYPGADVFTLFDALTPEQRRELGFERATTSFLQSMPFIRSRHRAYLPLMPLAIEQFDLSAYDLVISSSYAVAKGVLTGPDQLHVAYVHSPMRYAWDLQHSYLRESGYGRGLKGMLARTMLHYMRLWDSRTASGPDVIIANSAFVARRIRKVYGREAAIIHPPVTLSKHNPDVPRRRHFLAASRLVPYKNIETVVEAFRLLPELELVVAGDGPERKRLRALAASNVRFAGFVSDTEMRALMASARALIFAAEEDFGIIPVEAQSEGTPVLALNRGGARETVVAAVPQRTGLFFDRPEPRAIADCVRRFLAEEHTFSRAVCRANASRFSAPRFRAEFKALIDRELERARCNRGATEAPRPVPSLVPA
ncbi:MAG: glycosyltransferase [Hyphomicrobiales bacterium]|nr:glycosyltransferase [Hyphomicrobiales bacterium]